MELRQYLAVLRPHWRWILALVAVASVLSLAVTYIKAPTYVAAVTLQILPSDLESKAYTVRTAEGGSSVPLMRDPTESLTQGYAETARSLSVAQEVVRRLALDQPTSSNDLFSMLKGWSRGLFERVWAYIRYGEYKENDPLTGAAREVRDNLSTKPVKATYILSLEARAKKPDQAAAVANTAAQVFAERVQRDRVQGLKAEREHLEERMRALDEQLARGREDMRTYSERNLIVGSDEQIKVRLNYWVQTLSAVQTVDSQIEESKANLEAISPQLGKTPPTSTNVLIDKQQTESNQRVLSSSETNKTEEVPNPLYEKLSDSSLSLERQVEGLRQRRVVLADALEKAEKELAAWPGKELQLDNLVFKLNLGKQNYSELNTRHQATLLAETRPVEAVRVVDEASAPLYPSQPIKIFYVGVALAAALVVGIAAAFTWDYYRGTIHSREQLERLLGKPLLATVPTAGLNRSGQQAVQNLPVVAGGSQEAGQSVLWGLPRAMAIDREAKREADAQDSAGLYQGLLVSLELATQSMAPATILISTPSRETCVPSIVAGLGLASGGRKTKTLLVDANVRRPSLSRELGLNGDKGLVDVLSGSVSLAEAVERVVPDVDALAAARPSPSRTEMFNREALEAFLVAAGKEYRMMLVSAPPLLSHGGILLLTAICKQVVLVVARDVDTEDEVLRCVSMLRGANATDFGAILAT